MERIQGQDEVLTPDQNIYDQQPFIDAIKALLITWSEIIEQNRKPSHQDMPAGKIYSQI
jgi:hypothetical protein